MSGKLTEKAAFVLFKLTLFAKRNYLLNEFLTISGLAPLLARFRDYSTRGIREKYFEADLYGTKIKIIDGTDRHEYYEEALRGGIYEPALAGMLKKLLSAGGPVTFVDIGAHIGYFTVYAGRLIGKRGNVISIEPNPDYYGQVVRNIEINGLGENVRTFKIGLSDRSGRAETTGWEERDLVESETGSVEVATFDRLCAAEGIRPDVVKIDVHGAEYKVLSGMTRALDEHVKHLFLETHPEDLMQGYKISDVVNLLDRAKFDLFQLNDFRTNAGGGIAPLGGDLRPDMMIYARRK
ncbi:MAG: FkbM family methyltransferase [Thermodesulfobacteriota bacterium]